MEERNNIPFPQANDFDKVLKLLMIDDQNKLNNQQCLLAYLELGTTRQVLYYLSACEFLGIINKERLFTEFGNRLRKSSKDTRIILLCKAIIEKPVFGESFFLKYLFKEKLNKDHVSQLISELYGINNIAVCDRRAATVIKWLEWVDDQAITTIL